MSDITGVLNNLVKGKMPVLVVMVGAPGSGKSSFVQALCRSIPLMSVAHMDNPRNGERSTRARSWKQCMQDAHRALILRQPVCIDRTNMTREDRSTWLMATPATYRRVAVVITTPLNDCILRAKERNERPVPERVVTELYNKFERPTLKEGFTDIFLVSND